MGNSLGKIFRISTFGESHGAGLGVIIDGCPAGVPITLEEIQAQLDRRKPGQSEITTPRKESDRVQVLSGIVDGRTLGTSIGLLIPNEDAKSHSYDHMKDLYRPGHADFTYDVRYGLRDWRGGGRASNRETAARVAAGAIAQAMLTECIGSSAIAWVDQVHEIQADMTIDQVTTEAVEASIVRCPDPEAAKAMIIAISNAKKEGNSLGGKIRFVVKGCIPGLGAPVFDKLTADLAKAFMSIPATRAVSFGLGEKASILTGLEHNDPFMLKPDGKVGTLTNNAGGILGGISSGEPIYGSITFKPTATINKDQKTISTEFKEVFFKGKGRHDPCVLPRAVPIVEAMINLVLADHLLRFTLAKLDRVKKALS